jgi:hypothetical protein
VIKVPTINKLQNMTFDEVSLVRRPANQHASIVFSKADEGDDMPDVLYTEDGQEIDINDLEVGTEIELEDGQVYTVVNADEDDDDEPDEAVQDESEDAYGKSEDYGQMISKAYQEAIGDDQKAQLFATVAKSAEIAKAEARAAADSITKMHADAYVDQCISKADDYGFAGPRTQQFGVAIAKMMTVLDDEEIQLMDDIFKAFSELIDDVAIGSEAAGVSDVIDAVNGAADEIVKSAGGDMTNEQAMAAAFEANPDLYSLYLAEKEG